MTVKFYINANHVSVTWFATLFFSLLSAIFCSLLKSFLPGTQNFVIEVSHLQCTQIKSDLIWASIYLMRMSYAVTEIIQWVKMGYFRLNICMADMWHNKQLIPSLK